ncbi:MAG: hypothetical protein ACRD0H_11415 [Actinomycetes bacterium]
MDRVTRYPTTTEPFDEDAEGLALTEWEHTHARPTLRRLRLEEFDRLGRRLRGLARYSATLVPDSLEGQSRAARRALLDQVLEDLGRATELARQLQPAEE